MVHRFAHRWPVNASQTFQNLPYKCSTNLPKNWLVTALRVTCPKNGLYILFRHLHKYSLHFLYKFSKNCPALSKHIPNWPVNACLTSSHNYPMHTFLCSHYNCTVYSVIWSQKQRVTPDILPILSILCFVPEMLYLRRRVANYFNLFQLQIPKSTFTFTVLPVSFIVLGTS